METMEKRKRWNHEMIADIVLNRFKDGRRIEMGIIKGLHHISLKCCNQEEYDKVYSFYNDVLEMPVLRRWKTGVMFDTGNGIIEVFNNGTEDLPQGVIRHIALATDDVDECISKIRESGYEVFIEPKDIVIASVPEYPARIAFCKGPLGEEVELFQER